ncbi:MAG: proliferating cell nuclear antigen (pcna) [Nanoarchaeota archaeon]|nr:proliferating cell nuclear antigen (pcna) [Nanoarchaeota archaeon]MCG2718287.1 proliferating cell nuclear antigen (pcna) [Nanoarchaeota archaeon]
MKLVLAEPRLLKESVSIISELVNEVTFNIDKDKIEIVAMDPANVAMILFKLLSSAFVEYEVKENKQIAVNLENLNQVLKRSKPSDTVMLELADNKLKITLRGESTRTFKLSLIDIDESEQKVPELKFTTKVEMPSTVFTEAVEDMDVVAESVSMMAEQNKFTVRSEGRFNAAKVEVLTDQGISIVMDEDKVDSKYSIEYLKKIMKGSKLTDTVVLNFGKEYPLKVDYKLMDKLMLSFILAPRVDND